jgi:16S rRNA (cytosine1402-N4)-methyltransferase
MSLLARTIVEAREVQLIKTTDELKEVLARYLPDRVRTKKYLLKSIKPFELK